jgi:hypothetical protein
MAILWALPCFLAAVVLHAVVVRLSLRGDAVTKFVAAGGVAGVGLLALLLLLDAPALIAVAAVVAFAFTCELYIFLFTLVGQSVSVRILLELRAGELRREEIDALYDPRDMVQGRIARMRATGLLEPGGFRVTPRGQRLVRIFLGLKRFFGHPLPVPMAPAAKSRPSRQVSGIA